MVKTNSGSVVNLKYNQPGYGTQDDKMTRLCECKNARMQECKNARMQECKNARMHECMNAR